jgi:tRNA A-37 threonylcarbamoyl transferase component Bud32
LSGQHIGSYEIVRMLARGGMAVVYLVRQPALDREVVLKRLDLERDDPTLAQRFVREARLAAALDHPNVVTLFDFFEDDGVPYIAMEYVAGGSLRSLVGALELPQVLGALEGTLAALAHAERHEIAHRDLKPENVLLTKRGNVKIADFGIARAYNALSQRLTITGKAMGTPVYMAPEQATGRAIGPQTDLYALGVITYELLAGNPPFESDTPMGVLYCHVHKPPPPLPRSVRPPVREWVGWLLEKSPADRPQSAGEAWRALEEIAVAELGPYWRRAAAITAPTTEQGEVEEEGALTTTEESATPKTQAAPTLRLPEPAPPPRPRRRRFVLPAAAGGVLAVAAVGLITSLPDDARMPARPTPRPQLTRDAAVPYDFDGDGRSELVVSVLRAGLRGTRRQPGVVLLRRGDGWKTITEKDAHMPGRPGPSDQFGSGMTSGDFDRDGAADLAVGAPGRNRVSILYGTGRGLAGGRRTQLRGPHRYGFSLVADDMTGDGYDDLIASAPGTGAERGEVRLLLGGPRGLSARRARTLGRPATAIAAFGTRMRTGDVDGDDYPDLIEGGPDKAAGPGHASLCRGSRAGPRRCQPLGTDATASIGVADVNQDGYADIAIGDPWPPPGGYPAGGVVRLWLGSRRGPRPAPIVISQESPRIPGRDEPNDQFGLVLDTGDVDDDGFADIVIAATGEDEEAGRVTVIRGGRRGYTTTGVSSFDQNSPNVPGRKRAGTSFGSTLAILNVTADGRPDLVVAVRGERHADSRLMVVEGGSGVFAPDETRTRVLSGLTALVDLPLRGRIRVARVATG